MGNPSESAAATPSTVPSASTRPRCQYGEKCFRKNQDHKAEFSHPGDSDWEAACHQCGDAPAAPLPGREESVEDRGLLGAAGGAAAVLAAGGATHHFGAFDYSKEHEGAGGIGQFVHDHPGRALAGGAAAIIAGAFAGHKLEDAVKGSGKNKDKKEGKSKKGKKEKKDKKGSKKDKCTKSRALVLGEESDSSSESSSEEEHIPDKH